MSTFRVDQTSGAVVVQAASSASARRARLDRLKQATQEYVAAEKQRIEDLVANLQDILDARTGGQGLVKYPALVASKLADDSLADFLAGHDTPPLQELPGTPEQPELPAPVLMPVAYTPTAGAVPAAPQNYSGRSGKQIDTVVVHVTQGDKRGAALWFQDPVAGVSAHYIVGQDGSITTCVAESLSAWHAGNRSVNKRSIGIECEGFITDPSMWTDALMGTLIGLVRDVCKRYSIPVNRTQIIGHNEVPGATHIDPGSYIPWDRLLNGVSGLTVA